MRHNRIMARKALKTPRGRNRFHPPRVLRSLAVHRKPTTKDPKRRVSIRRSVTATTNKESKEETHNVWSEKTRDDEITKTRRRLAGGHCATTYTANYRGDPNSKAWPLIKDFSGSADTCIACWTYVVAVGRHLRMCPIRSRC